MPVRKLPTLRSLMQHSPSELSPARLENGSWLFEQNVRASSWIIACGYFVQVVKRVIIKPRVPADPDAATVAFVKQQCDKAVEGVVALMEEGYPVASLLDVAIKARITREDDTPHIANILRGVEYGNEQVQRPDHRNVNHGGTG